MRQYLWFFIIIFTHSSAQQWTIVGDTVASGAGASYPKVAVDGNGTPYIVYYDVSSNTGGAAVKKFNGSQWVDVGTHPTTGWVINTAIDIDSSGSPYIAISDGNYNKKATVKKFDGTNWITIGTEGFTQSAATFISLKISPDGTPYIAFRDMQYNYSASVMKFDGTTWVYVGQPGFSPQAPNSGAGNTRIAIDGNGVLYVAFIDLTNNWRASVMKFNGNNWVYVGNPNISGGSADLTSIVVDSHNSPIVSYSDGNAQVKKFNGTTWVQIGQPSFVANIDLPTLVIDKNDGLYLAYTSNQKVSVQKFNGAAWIQAGNAAFSPSLAGSTSIAVDTTGNIFTCFMDATDRPDGQSGVYHSACVMKLNQNNISTNTLEKLPSDFLFEVFPNPTDNALSINYYNRDNEAEGILTITSAIGETVYRQEIKGSFSNILCIRQYSKGMYFVELKTPSCVLNRKIIIQ